MATTGPAWGTLIAEVILDEVLAKLELERMGLDEPEPYLLNKVRCPIHWEVKGKRVERMLPWDEMKRDQIPVCRLLPRTMK